jgi:(R)-amidase
MNPLRLRLIQSTLRDGDVRGNLEQALAHITAARGHTDLVVFSETYLQGFPTPDTIDQLAESVDGPSLGAVRDAARAAGVAVVIGCAERDGHRHFNTALLIDEQGEIRLRYRKIHRYESDLGVFDAGEAFPICVWRGVPIGLLICFDLEFPETARALARQGAHLIVIADGMMNPYGSIHRAMLPVRALENQVFVAMANRVGPGERYTFCGTSLVAAPDGAVVAVAPDDRDAVVDVRLDLDEVARARAAFSYVDLAAVPLGPVGATRD